MALGPPPITTPVLQPTTADGKSVFTPFWYKWFQGLGSAASSSGSFTGTLTGFTASLTGTVYWATAGGIVLLNLVNMAQSGTSNATTFTMTGLPGNLKPARNQSYQQIIYTSTDNNAGTSATMYMSSAGVLNFFTLASNGIISGWTASSTKGFRYIPPYAYSLV